MEVIRPCTLCGSRNIHVGPYQDVDYAVWFVKCKDCSSASPVLHAVKEEAIRQWNNQYCWDELDKATKRAEESEARERRMRIQQTEDTRILQYRYEKLLDEYIKYRMLYNGTAGNLNMEARKTLMKKELSEELGWPIS